MWLVKPYSIVRTSRWTTVPMWWEEDCSNDSIVRIKAKQQRRCDALDSGAVSKNEIKNEIKMKIKNVYYYKIERLCV